MGSSNRLAIALCFTTLLPALAAAQELAWRYDYNLARKESSDKNRPMLLDFVTDHCFWCKKLDTTTFREPAVASVMNQHFVLLKVDADKNPQLAQALRIQSYPTMIIASADGRILTIIEGFVESPKLLDSLHKALGKTAPPAPAVMARAQRTVRARELLAQAREEHRLRQYAGCLEKCELVASGYADLPEGKEAARLAREIKSNPEALAKACEHLNERLSQMYLTLADSWIKRGDSDQAVACLERVQRDFAGTAHAQMAQTKLRELQGRPAIQTDFKKAP